MLGRHETWLGFTHRGTTGATARRSGVDPCLLSCKDRHSATGLMAHKTGQRDFSFRWPFALQKYPSHKKASHPARGKPAPRRLRRSRAAIGSGGKRPAHFDGGKRRARARSARMRKLASFIARDIASPAVKMGNRSLFPAGERSEPRSRIARRLRRPKPTAHSDVGRLWSRRAAGFLWYFRFERKYFLGAVAPPPAPESARQSPVRIPWQSWHTPSRGRGLPAGQTISAARTALPFAVICPNFWP